MILKLLAVFLKLSHFMLLVIDGVLKLQIQILYVFGLLMLELVNFFIGRTLALRNIT